MSALATPGEMLGRYQVVKHLASGGMAQVLLAKATGIEGFERYVVIKRIHVERAHDETIVKMFLDEARLAAALHHQHVVQVQDIGQEKGEYFFAMEYVHGEDLRTLLTKLNHARKTLPLEHVVTIVMAAASALHYAHEFRGPDRKPLNIVHRDVSPANILVGYDGQVKVVDFGIAKAAVRSSETQSGTLKGKISYMAPEQCMGEPVDRRSDVFALGIVLWELFCVRRLFKGSSDFLTMTAIVNGKVPKPSVHRPDVPPELETIIMKALAMAPDQRYQTAEELQNALDAFATAQGLRTSSKALASFMVAEFGKRPEPWLVDDDEAEIEVFDVDFDGAADAAPSSKPALHAPTPPPGSLLARAKRKMAPASGVELTPMPPERPAKPEPDAAIIAASTGWSADDKVATTASGTPMAWTPTLPIAETPKRKRGVLLAAIATVAVLGVGIVVATRSSSSVQSGSSTAAPGSASPNVAAPVVPVVEPPPPVEPPPVEPPPVEPPPVEPPPVVAVPEPPIPPPVKKTGKKATTVKKATTTTTGPQEKWNPDKLFLKKKK